jgi:hypothetical protein
LLASRFAPWTPVHAASPAGKQTGQRGSSPFVGVDAAHDVVRGGTHRDEIVREIEAEAAAHRGDRRKSFHDVRGIEMRQRQTDWRLRTLAFEHDALATTSRGARSPSGW